MDIKTQSGKVRSIKVTEPLKEEILSAIRNNNTKVIEKKSQYVSKLNIQLSIGDSEVVYDKLKKQIISLSQKTTTQTSDEIENIPVEMTKLLKQFAKK